MSQPVDQKKNNFRYAMNMTMASIAGQVGCLTLAVIFAALFAGLWLDRYLDTKPLFTIVILLGSVPVTLFLMFRLVKAATDRIKPIQKDSLINTYQEEVNRD
ncbi:MAG: AtpZ/AtpI family protein [Anaerolineales bacterium]|nr:AtpZ/AtpI family protein [Anaerolineales bacterium]